MSVTDTVFLFPTAYVDLETADPDAPYETIDISTGTYLGLTGIRVPEDKEYGYDAVFGWQDAFGLRSTAPYKSIDEAVNGLRNHVLTNGEVEGEEL